MIYAIITMLLLICELAYFRVADKFNIIDKPNLRSSHHRIVLRGGGIIFLIGAWIYQAFFGTHYMLMMAGLTAIGIISFIDDVHSVPNRYRLLVQFTSVLLMFANLYLYNANTWWIIIPALIICVGIINAYNFMDGINGITGAYSLAVLIPLAYLDHSINFIDMNFLIITGLSILVFLIFNFRKRAKCFSGDVGSISLAFILLFALGRLIVATQQPAYILFLGVYGVDSVFTIIHRIMLHENLGEAHRKHAYQLLTNELKLPHIMVASIYMLLQLAISFGLILFINTPWIYFIIACSILGIIYVLFMRQYYHLHAEYLKTICK